MASLAKMPLMPPMGLRKRHESLRSKTLQVEQQRFVLSAQLCLSRVQGPVSMQLQQGVRLLASASHNNFMGTLQDWHQEDPCWPEA